MATANSVLPLFWTLTSAKADERASAASQLIQHLTASQEAFRSELSVSDWQAALESVEARSLGALQEKAPSSGENLSLTGKTELDKICSSDLCYTIKRLIRGLPSSRQDSRQIFAVILTQLLSIFSFIPASLVMTLLNQYTVITNGMKNGEEKDIYLGRLCAYIAFEKAGLFKGVDISADVLLAAVTDLLEISKKRWLLREAVSAIVIEIAKSPKFKEILAQSIALIQEDGISPESLWIACELQSLYPKYDWSIHLFGWNESKLLHADNADNLCQVLKESTSSHPRVHRIWTFIFEQMEINDSSLPFNLFWKAAVDDCLFNSASHEKKYLGFQLFLLMCRDLSTQQLPLLFSPNFLRCLNNSLSEGEKNLNKAAVFAFERAVEISKTRPELGIILIPHIHSSSLVKLPKEKKAKATEQILSSLNEDGTESYFQILTDNFKADEKTDHSLIWSLDQLVGLVRNSKVPKTEDLVRKISIFLAEVAFGEGISVSENVKNVAIARFSSLLAELLFFQSNKSAKVAASAEKKKLSEGIDSAGKSWIVSLFQTITASLTEKPNDLKSSKKVRKSSLLFKLRVEYTENEILVENLKLASKLLSKLESKAANDDSSDKAFGLQILISYCGFTMLNAQEAPQAIETLNDVHEIYKRLLESSVPPLKAKKKKSLKEEVEDDEEDTSDSPIEVLIDLLLAHLAKPCILARKVAEIVFSRFCGDLTAPALDLITSVLEKSESLDGQAELFDEQDNEADEESSSEDSEDDEVQVQNSKKRVAVEENIGEDKETDEDEEPTLDDDEMEAFDSKLAEIFLQKKMDKEGKKNAVRQVLHFKFKILDLLEIFVKKEPSHPLIPQLFVTLLQAIKKNSTTIEQSEEHAKLLRKMIAFGKNKLAKHRQFPVDSSKSMLKDFEGLFLSVLEFAETAPGNDLQHMASACSAYLLKAIASVSPKSCNELAINGYTKSLSAYFAKKTKLQMSFYLELIERLNNPSIVSSLACEMLQKYYSKSKKYQQMQVIHFTSEVIKRCNSPDESDSLFVLIEQTFGQILRDISSESSNLDVLQRKEIYKLVLQVLKKNPKKYFAESVYEPLFKYLLEVEKKKNPKIASLVHELINAFKK